jgi:hypothetical protein
MFEVIEHLVVTNGLSRPRIVRAGTVSSQSWCTVQTANAKR